MKAGKTAHDIIEGTLFRFHPDQYLTLYINDEEQFRYVYRCGQWQCTKGMYDEKVIAYMGLKRIRETLLPVKPGKRPRRNFFVLRPAFIMDGKLVFVDSFDMLYPFAGQDNIFKEDV